MKGDVGHMGGLINPRPERGQYLAGFSNTGGSPKPRKRALCQKRPILLYLSARRKTACFNYYVYIGLANNKHIPVIRQLVT